jgi:beta-N-acetylhexosaminidase
MSVVALGPICGGLVVGGFAGTSIPRSFEARLAKGELGGAILFARNLTPDPDATAALCEAIVAAAASAPDAAVAPVVSVDQEGGRVARLKSPVLVLPPAAVLGARCDAAELQVLGEALGAQLAALGFSMDYAPVLDVHTNPRNPIIGDRAFGTEPEHAARAALAFARGLEACGVSPCGKHYPGHGDTSQDSHIDLPFVEASRARLDAVELLPFRRAAEAKLPALMSAHVVFPALADGVPATLARAIATDLLRGELGFEGVLVSDDLEMRAIADRFGIAEAAVLAVDAGCDALLICSDEAAQGAAVEALVRRAERDATFRERCEQAHRRTIALRRRFTPRGLRGTALAEALGPRPAASAILAKVARSDSEEGGRPA